jgi:hypothetical protein
MEFKQLKPAIANLYSLGIGGLDAGCSSSSTAGATIYSTTGVGIDRTVLTAASVK